MSHHETSHIYCENVITTVLNHDLLLFLDSHNGGIPPTPIPGIRNIRIHKFGIFNYIHLRLPGNTTLSNLYMCKFTHAYRELKQRGISENCFKKKKYFCLTITQLELNVACNPWLPLGIADGSTHTSKVPLTTSHCLEVVFQVETLVW